MSILRVDQINTLDNSIQLPLNTIVVDDDMVASNIEVTPTGNLASTDVQAALVELQGDVDGVNTALGTKQPVDATLTALSGVTTAADQLIYATGADTFSTTALTPFARTLLDDADAATARTTLGISTTNLGTAQSAVGVTAVDFTGIPETVNRINVLFSNLSNTGSNNYLLQIGSSSVETTGYASTGSIGGTVITSTGGFIACGNITSTLAFTGAITLTRITGNTWVATGVGGGDGNGSIATISTGTKSLSAPLTRLRFTCATGIDAFDSGTINIIYEV